MNELLELSNNSMQCQGNDHCIKEKYNLDVVLIDCLKSTTS
ncbi:MAG: hypothetical protein WCS04_06795 [Sphaerochaetaceae bacterium]